MKNSNKWSENLEMKTVILPTGSFEAHGAHLPLTTDAIIPERIAEEAAKKTGVFVLPTIPYGNTQEMSNFKGTISVTAQGLVTFTKDILESAVAHGAENIIIINGHIGNEHSFEVAARDVIAKSDKKLKITVVNVWGGLIKMFPAHAGKEETSLILYLEDGSVDLKKAINQPLSEEAETPYMMRHYFYNRKIPCEGEPKNASKELGKKLFDEIVGALVDLIRKF